MPWNVRGRGKGANRYMQRKKKGKRDGGMGLDRHVGRQAGRQAADTKEGVGEERKIE